MSSEDKHTYTVRVNRVWIGFIALVVWSTDDSIPLAGPTYWRPTRAWAQARADRHVARRLRMHEREANAKVTTWPA